MPVTHDVEPRPGDTLLLVGTMKGAFILRADAERRQWDVGGPYFPGSAVYGMAFDARAGRHRIWAGRLWAECPAIRDRVLTERGDVRPHINIFVDGDNIRFSGRLETPVRDGAEVFLVPAVSGG